MQVFMLAELMFWFVFLSELSINPVYVFYMRCISHSINISYFHVCHSQLPQRTKYTAEAICVNPLLSGVPFLYPLKTSENLWFSDVFSGNKKEIPDSNGLYVIDPTPFLFSFSGHQTLKGWITQLLTLREKCPYSGFFWSVFYFVFLRIQSKCEKIRTRKTPNTDIFHAVLVLHFDSSANSVLHDISVCHILLDIIVAARTRVSQTKYVSWYRESLEKKI